MVNAPNSNTHSNSSDRQIRYALVELGWIAQATVLPAFAHAENSELVAFVSGLYSCS